MTMLSMPLPTLADLSIEPGLPTVVSPRSGAAMSLEEAAPLLHAIADDTLERAGGVLFTGFRVASIDAFQSFAGSFGHPLIGYEFASTPRSQVEGAVYTSTEYPPHRSIPLHNEQSYTREWPLRIWFHCALAARSGGATPIADSSRDLSRTRPGARRTLCKARAAICTQLRARARSAVGTGLRFGRAERGRADLPHAWHRLRMARQ